ncbi:MMPL family transporter [Heyndrickxia shackletonii]|uniref:MMPL family transporter n=1 Tax=Heyndrickxia shackletonii TaxID=157838 RepID=UPI0009F8C8D1|nr:MMPL family transporter [Heyndrickxia shackletonii]NEZ01532.1 MMPL family transporter [Heyndrickxia shackletonii]
MDTRVDYSIFLMMRFKEYPHLSPKEAIVLASKHTGGVIISAVIILGGTFATLMPAGIVPLSELSIAVITGLIVLCFVLLPIFIPALIALPDALANVMTRKKGRSFKSGGRIISFLTSRNKMSLGFFLLLYCA